MPSAAVADITHVIQLSVAPVFMLTAVGTLIAALSIRLGRATDRRRALEREIAELAAEDSQTARAELGVIAQRVRIAYHAIFCAVLAGLFVCLMIASAFLGAFVAVNLARLVGALFVLAMLALIGCLLLFLREIFLAVSAPRYVPAQPRAPARD